MLKYLFLFIISITNLFSAGAYLSQTPYAGLFTVYTETTTIWNSSSTQGQTQCNYYNGDTLAQMKIATTWNGTTHYQFYASCSATYQVEGSDAYLTDYVIFNAKYNSSWTPTPYGEIDGLTYDENGVSDTPQIDNGFIDQNGDIICNSGYEYSSLNQSCNSNESYVDPESGEFCGSQSNAINIIGNECGSNTINSYDINETSDGCYNSVSWNCGDNVGTALITSELSTNNDSYYYDNSTNEYFSSSYDPLTDKTTISYSNGTTKIVNGRISPNTDISTIDNSETINNETGGITVETGGTSVSSSLGSDGGTSETTSQSGNALLDDETASDLDINALLNVMEDLRANQVEDNKALNENIQDTYIELVNVNNSTQAVNNTLLSQNKKLDSINESLQYNPLNNTVAAQVNNPLDSIEEDQNFIFDQFTNFYENINSDLQNLENIYTQNKYMLENGSLDFTLNQTVTSCPTNYQLDLSTLLGKVISLDLDFCEFTSKLYNIIYPLLFVILTVSFTLFNFKLIRSL
mgnify:CR=1 FL=1